MKCFIIILLSLIPLSYAKPPVVRTDRMRHWMQFIIGGSEVEDFSRFAYQLSLRYVEVHVCGASIIAEKWALTAAHCLDNNIWPDMISFRAGSRHRFEGGIIVNAEQYFIHPLFDYYSYDFDVAVVRTIERFVGPDVRIIPLIPMGHHIRSGTKGTISGWGIVDEGYLPIYLQKLDLAVWDQQQCFVKWYGEITSNMFCAGGEPGYDSCNGDSGGAMVYGDVQIGIVSTGALNCGINYPGVYTNITHPSIRAFIQERTGV